ncbi:hypothetical protein RHMOL_Rhmol05G0301400 [Rhododendron molle]|uniref:Uncharacterized protein n=1 Tax=Rhododendron molle TaxID=49168 RepID=A0ACC0NWY1_RHOML|nr:hypothetical protein RHMOL_Rhmol05G0301400 [Rhododendron molle]
MRLAARVTFHLLLEITIEILSRLPVKSLLRFKSVCKTWYDLIKTPDFISKHLLNHSTLNHTPLLVTSSIRGTKNHEMSLLFNDGLNNGSINLGFPLINCFSIAGICNGLVCVRLSPLGYRLILCNPSTRQFREIPGAERNWEEENMQHVEHVSFGFGFHSSANDYKLIRIVLYSTPSRENNIRADLYVMSTNTWTAIDVKLLFFFGEMNEYGGYDTISQIEGSSTSALLNGVFYWPALVFPSLPTDPVVVMSFDMGNEVFRRITTPVVLGGTWYGANLQCMELNDKLDLVVSPPKERGFDVWVLNEMESSWTHQVKVGSFPRIASEMGNGKYSRITVVGGLKNGELLVTGDNVSGELKLFPYDIKIRETMDLYFGQLLPGSCVCVYLYAGSLLPIMQANEMVLNK